MGVKFKSLILISAVLILFVENTISRRHSRRKAENPLAKWQKWYLDKIQLQAREGGLSSEEWKDITTYDEDVCYDMDCLSSALEIMQATNFTASPCTEWLDYVCDRRVSGPDNINQLERLMRDVEKRTKNLLLNTDPKLVEQNFLLKEAQTYYYQCKNRKLHDTKDIQDTLDYLDTTYGGWPMMTNADPDSKFDWFKMVADLNRIERIGFQPLLLNVTATHSSPYIQLGLGQLSFPVSQADFENMMKRIQEASGRNKPYRLEQFGGFIAFINSAQQASLVSPSNMIVSIEGLQKRTDQYFKKNDITNLDIDWLKFFQIVFKGSDIEIASDDTPYIHVPFNQVMGIMKAVSTSFKNNGTRPVSNALNFQLTTMLLQESTDILDDLNTFKCTEQSGTREDICYARTIELFGYSLGKSYLSKYYDADVDTPGIEELMVKIQQGYINLIDGISYMEDTTKDKLRDKVRSMKTFIAEPEWTKDPTKLEKFYETLTASDDHNSSFPLNYLNVTSWGVAKQRSWGLKLASLATLEGLTLYDVEWSRYLGNVQAQYHKSLNQARIEGGIVQSPLFGVKRPGFMNFGGLGMVLAHEIGHSYDTQGRLYDKNGVEGEFWDDESVKKYNEWVESILKDYGSAVHRTSDTTKETFNPNKTVNEDIADILGIHISFLAYKDFLRELEAEGKTEKILPGLKNFTNEKLFYMKYGNMWCDRKEVQDHFNDLLQNHSSGNTRATLPLKRSREFADTFGCKEPESL